MVTAQHGNDRKLSKAYQPEAEASHDDWLSAKTPERNQKGQRWVAAVTQEQTIGKLMGQYKLVAHLCQQQARPSACLAELQRKVA